MSDSRRDPGAAPFGIESLMDVDSVDPIGQPGQSHPPRRSPGRPLRRDIHWWIGGAMLLLALPMLAWQAAGIDEGVERSGRALSGATGAAAGGTPVRPPESTSALDRTIDDQARVGSLPPLPPLPPMSSLPRAPSAAPEAGMPSPEAQTGPGMPGLSSRPLAPRSAQPALVPQAIDPVQSRHEALAAEAERRVAEARSSPLLAIGSAGAGVGSVAAGAAGSLGTSAAALAAMVRDASGMPVDRAAAAALLPNDPRAPVAGMIAGDARSDSHWLAQARLRPPVAAATGDTLRPGPAGPALLEGTVIPAVLLTEINSDLPGTLVAQVTQDIWDSVHGRHLLVPKGSRLVGDYNSDVRPGQARVLAAFRRLILPDGSSIDLQGTQATDAQGRSGLHDRVDRHFWTLFGSSFVIAALASIVQRREALPSTVIVVPGGTGGSASAVSSAAGNVLVETSRAILGRSRNVSPTLLISQGHRFSLTVQKTFLLDRADDVTMAEGSR